jgi:hypothetical protein
VEGHVSDANDRPYAFHGFVRGLRARLRSKVARRAAPNASSLCIAPTCKDWWTTRRESSLRAALSRVLTSCAGIAKNYQKLIAFKKRPSVFRPRNNTAADSSKYRLIVVMDGFQH